MSGYTQTELDDIQAKWDLRFPPDLLALYRERRRVIDHGEERYSSLDWIKALDDVIRDTLNWPLEGFLFDVRHGAWWPEWGETPATGDEREERLRAVFADAPKLVPVYGHRYIPQDPHETGNPIYSVWQMDVIHYGANLADYVEREGRFSEKPWPSLKGIPFWSRAVEFNGQRFVAGGGRPFLNKGQVLPN